MRSLAVSVLCLTTSCVFSCVVGHLLVAQIVNLTLFASFFYVLSALHPRSLTSASVLLTAHFLGTSYRRTPTLFTTTHFLITTIPIVSTYFLRRDSCITFSQVCFLPSIGVAVMSSWAVLYLKLVLLLLGSVACRRYHPAVTLKVVWLSITVTYFTFFCMTYLQPEAPPHCTSSFHGSAPSIFVPRTLHWPNSPRMSYMLRQCSKPFLRLPRLRICVRHQRISHGVVPYSFDKFLGCHFC